MDKADKKILQKNRVQLVEEMRDEVLDHLLNRQIYKPTDQEGFLEIKGPSKRNTAILNDIVRRGPKAFRALAESLFAADSQDLATLLIPNLTADTLYDLSWYDYTNQNKTPAGGSASAADAEQCFNKPPVQQSALEGAGGGGDFSTTNRKATQVSQEGNVSSAKNAQSQPEPERMECETSQPTQESAWPVKTAEEVLDMKITKGSYESEMTDNPNNYTIKSKPRGKALIINNRNFRSMPLRKGTDVDARQLESLFTKLGFDVENKVNLKYEEFTKKMNQYSQVDHSRYDCFILAVLTHGVNGALYSVDERLIQIDDIQKCFTGDSCPTLTGKPKLFFIQACRGACDGHSNKHGLNSSWSEFKVSLAYLDGLEERKTSVIFRGILEMFDQGVEATDGTGDPSLQSLNQVGDVDNPRELVDKMLKVELDETDASAWGSQVSKLPSHSDMLLAYATVPGYVSWRNSERGSWFVQALTETFLQYARDEDLMSMLTMVNNKVARAFESSSGRNKQMPAPVTMLTKKLFFFPGHYES